MNSPANTTDLRFVFVPAEDDTVDSGYDLYDGDVLTDFSVQDASGYGLGYCVNQYGPSRENLEWIEQHGIRLDLARAQELAKSCYLSWKGSAS